MTQQLQIPLIRIGSSRGIRIPKKIIDRLGFHDQITAVVTDDSITLTPALKPREGWEADFKRCHREGQDSPLIPDDLDVDAWDNL